MEPCWQPHCHHAFQPHNPASDSFHVAHPAVSCTYRGLEGLQREYGQDRVRQWLAPGWRHWRVQGSRWHVRAGKQMAAP